MLDTYLWVIWGQRDIFRQKKSPFVSNRYLTMGENGIIDYAYECIPDRK